MLRVRWPRTMVQEEGGRRKEEGWLRPFSIENLSLRGERCCCRTHVTHSHTTLRNNTTTPSSTNTIRLVLRLDLCYVNDNYKATATLGLWLSKVQQKVYRRQRHLHYAYTYIYIHIYRCIYIYSCRSLLAPIHPSMHVWEASFFPLLRRPLKTIQLGQLTLVS